MLSVNNKPVKVYSDFYILHVWGGFDELSFILPRSGEIYSSIKAENPVKHNKKSFTVKSISELDDEAVINCKIDLDDLKNKMIADFSGSKTLNEVLTTILAATGWSSESAGIATNSATWEAADVTPYDILNACVSLYNVAFDFDTESKIVHVIKPDMRTPIGLPVTEKYNLRRVDYKSDTYDLVTRLYPYGKDGLTIAAVNSGLEYIENYQYSVKTISLTWRDERYEVAQNLKDAAIEKLNTLSKPKESYELDVASIPEQTFHLYDIVTYMDAEKKRSINYQVVQYKEYPDEIDRDVITLSTVPETVKGWVQQEISEVNEEILIEKAKTNEIRRDVDENSARISTTYSKGETETVIASLVQQAVDVLRSEIISEYVTDESFQQYISTLEQYVDGIDFRTSIRGGYNLLMGTAAFDLENWTTIGSVSTERNTADTVPTDSGGRFIIGNGTASSISQTMRTVPGGMYCYMIRYKLTGGTATGGTLTVRDNDINLPPAADWTTVQGRFTADSGQTTLRLSNRYGVLSVADIVVLAGAQVDTWQQGQNEIITDGWRYTNGRLIIYGSQADPLQTEITNAAVYVRDQSTSEIKWQVSINGVELDRTEVRENLRVRAKNTATKALSIIPLGNGHVYLTISD